MGVTVKIPTQLRNITGGDSETAVDGATTVGDVLDGLYDRYDGLRPHSGAWAAKKLRVGGPEALLDYQREKNAHSIDGLPAVDLPDPAADVELVDHAELPAPAAAVEQ